MFTAGGLTGMAVLFGFGTGPLLLIWFFVRSCLDGPVKQKGKGDCM